MQNNLKTIREACIKSNPSILNLEFGCEVIFNTRKLFITGHALSDEKQVLIGDKFESKYFVKKSDLEIIGRPIRLADIVLALHTKLSPTQDLIFKEIADKVIQDIRNQIMEVVVRWNLKNDNLENQSEETLQFLAELLK